MLVNVTNSRIVVGRISVLPGEKVPSVALTAKEEAGIKKLVSRGYLEEKPGVHKSQAVKQEEVVAKVAAAVAEEAKKATDEKKPEKSEKPKKAE